MYDSSMKLGSLNLDDTMLRALFDVSVICILLLLLPCVVNCEDF